MIRSFPENHVLLLPAMEAILREMPQIVEFTLAEPYWSEVNGEKHLVPARVTFHFEDKRTYTIGFVDTLPTPLSNQSIADNMVGLRKWYEA